MVFGADVSPTTERTDVLEWVSEIAGLTTPDAIHWVTGSENEQQQLIEHMVAAGTIAPLNPETRPNSFIARSHESDVARVESRTFICSQRQDDAGPTNNWVDPDEMRSTLNGLFTGSMRGRTMYVVPFLMGPVGSPVTRAGIEITDSPYVVMSMGVMTRAGNAAMTEIDKGIGWVKAVHTMGAPLDKGDADVAWPCNTTKYITHFPESREIWSFGSAYGGNALLGKKAFALRIASAMAHDEGWLAEHMTLIRATSPEGEIKHIAAAFPSACGKTNFAMLTPTLPGWTIETLGDDIVWMWIDGDGRLRAINPETGFFGVAPGTNVESNPIAMETIWGNTIFTNVAVTDDNDVWWEGMTRETPAHLIDWRGDDWTPDSPEPASHPNARFTVPISQCPSTASDWEDPHGVTIDALVFGGRRRTTMPLVVEARSWQHGVYLGATMASERTAAAEGTVGELARDPFAMSPFTGYHVGDYWAHWLSIGERLATAGHAPHIFHVNWFRRGEDGRFLWPGFGENIRVVDWIVKRLSGKVDAIPSPVGNLPEPHEFNTDGLSVIEADLNEILTVDSAVIEKDAVSAQSVLEMAGERTPRELWDENAETIRLCR